MVYKKWSEKHVIKFFFEYGLHLWLIVFAMNVALFYAAHFYSIGKTCFTTAQVASDNRCLYIWSGKVYEKGSRSSPHQGHPCGTDVTSIIPPSHIASQAKYLLPNYVGDICTATVQPTSTPTPKPTNTPVPTAKPTDTPVPTQPKAPTATPVPTTAAVVAPTNTPIPTPTTKQTQTNASPTPTPTIQPTVAYTALMPTTTTNAGSPTSTPASTSVPTIAAPNGPGVIFSFAMPGIGSLAANVNPIHPTRDVTIFVYPPDQNTQVASVQPSYTTTAQALFDSDPASSTYTQFVVHADLGTNVPAGSYQIAFKTNQSITALVREDATAQQGTLFAATPGVYASVAPQVHDVIVGDINGDNTIDIQDYNLFADCYGEKAALSTCSAAQLADLNDDGLVDGVDYILMLEGIQSLISEGKIAVVQPTIQPTAAPTSLPTSTPAPVRQIARTTISVSLPESQKFTTVTRVRKTTPTPTPKPNLMKSLFAASNGIFLSKVFTVLAFVFLIGVGILGAYKSRIVTALAHRGTTEEKPHSAPTTAPSVPTGKTQFTSVYYVTGSAGSVVNGRNVITLTDKQGPHVGYCTQVPPAEGYYTVTGYEEEIDSVPSIIVLSLAPAAKPANAS